MHAHKLPFYDVRLCVHHARYAQSLNPTINIVTLHELNRIFETVTIWHSLKWDYSPK